MQLDPDERRTDLDDFFNKDEPSPLTPISIFFAVLAAILVAWLLKEIYDDLQARRALHQLNQEFVKLDRQMNRELKRLEQSTKNLYKNQSVATYSTNNKVRLPKVEKELNKELKQYQSERLKKFISINGLDVTNNRDKARAWAEFYKPSLACEEAFRTSNSDFPACERVNLEAIKEFEKIWAMGY